MNGYRILIRVKQMRLVNKEISCLRLLIILVLLKLILKLLNGLLRIRGGTLIVRLHISNWLPSPTLSRYIPSLLATPQTSLLQILRGHLL
jgi:hypothetical protein